MYLIISPSQSMVASSVHSCYLSFKPLPELRVCPKSMENVSLQLLSAQRILSSSHYSPCPALLCPLSHVMPCHAMPLQLSKNQPVPCALTLAHVRINPFVRVSSAGCIFFLFQDVSFFSFKMSLQIDEIYFLLLICVCVNRLTRL